MNTPPFCFIGGKAGSEDAALSVGHRGSNPDEGRESLRSKESVLASRSGQGYGRPC